MKLFGLIFIILFAIVVMMYIGAGMIEKRQTFWKEKTYQTVEKGNGWKIERPVEIKPLEDLLDDFFRRKKKWE